jgi:glycosyltransferase involved in cell wall biosynthesis
VTVSPTDTEGFTQAAENLLAHGELREFYGTNARRYAEETFRIGTIASEFEALLTA